MLLQTKRLCLRRLRVSDAPFLCVLLNTPAFLQNIGDRGVRTHADAKAYLQTGPLQDYAQHGFGAYHVSLVQTGASVGICGLFQRDYLPAPDLGFAFLEAYWGKGYATEAAAAVKHYAHETLGWPLLFAIAKPGNKPSIRVLQKLGFTLQAHGDAETHRADLDVYRSTV